MLCNRHIADYQRLELAKRVYSDRHCLDFYHGANIAGSGKYAFDDSGFIVKGFTERLIDANGATIAPVGAGKSELAIRKIERANDALHSADLGVKGKRKALRSIAHNGRKLDSIARAYGAITSPSIQHYGRIGLFGDIPDNTDRTPRAKLHKRLRFYCAGCNDAVSERVSKAMAKRAEGWRVWSALLMQGASISLAFVVSRYKPLACPRCGCSDVRSY